MDEPRFSPWARRRARRTLLQAIYAWQVAGADLADLRRQFSPDRGSGDETTAGTKGRNADSSSARRGPGRGVDEGYFVECLGGIVRGVAELDALFAPHLDRAVDALDQVERAILRAGTFELKERLDVPVRVVIDEWVELAKTFGAEESFRYVNGVLDRVARNTRGMELEAP